MQTNSLKSTGVDSYINTGIDFIIDKNFKWEVYGQFNSSSTGIGQTNLNGASGFTLLKNGFTFGTYTYVNTSPPTGFNKYTLTGDGKYYINDILIKETEFYQPETFENLGLWVFGINSNGGTNTFCDFECVYSRITYKKNVLQNLVTISEILSTYLFDTITQTSYLSEGTTLVAANVNSVNIKKIVYGNDLASKVFWGDGESEILLKAGIYVHVYTPNSENNYDYDILIDIDNYDYSAFVPAFSFSVIPETITVSATTIRVEIQITSNVQWKIYEIISSPIVDVSITDSVGNETREGFGNKFIYANFPENLDSGNVTITLNIQTNVGIFSVVITQSGV